MRGLAATSQWWEDDLGFLVPWVLVTGGVLYVRMRNEIRGVRSVAGTLCLAGFLGGWYAGYQEQAGGMIVPLARDVATLTGLISAVVYLVARVRHRRQLGSPE